MTKAYMSDQTDSEELRYCLRKGKDAGAELAKILKDTERAAEPGSFDGAFMARCTAQLPTARLHFAALRDSLAALVVDGGPLDQLAWEVATDAACADAADGIGDGLMLGVYLANAARYAQAGA